MSTDIVKKNQDILNTLKSSKSSNSLLKDLKSPEKVDKLIMILLDTSGSMCENMETDSKINVAWSTFHNKLLPNIAGWAYGIIGFGEEGYWITYPTSNPTALTTNNPHASGRTAMAHALNIAWGWTKTHAKEARFVMLSDGMPNDMPAEDVIKLVTENNRIPIDTVGIGRSKVTSWNSYDPEFLKKISALTGGIFTEVGTVSMLAETIKKLSPAERPLLGRVEKEVS